MFLCLCDHLYHLSHVSFVFLYVACLPQCHSYRCACFFIRPSHISLSNKPRLLHPPVEVHIGCFSSVTTVNLGMQLSPWLTDFLSDRHMLSRQLVIKCLKFFRWGDGCTLPGTVTALCDHKVLLREMTVSKFQDTKSEAAFQLRCFGGQDCLRWTSGSSSKLEKARTVSLEHWESCMKLSFCLKTFQMLQNQNGLFQNTNYKLGIVIHSYNPTIGKSKAEESWVWALPGLQKEILSNQHVQKDYIYVMLMS